jgi:ADP-ribose pyrophosphatase YjhB (NUDIX family)
MLIMAADKGPRIKKIPDGDTRERLTCPECDHIAYENPKVVNVLIATFEGEILLARRDIDPRKGYWTLPGGYMENGETPNEGALREAFEEAGAKGKPGPLVAICQPPKKNEVIMVFRTELSAREAEAKTETQEVKFFKWEDIPWKELAFPFVGEALHAWNKTKDKTEFQPEFIISHWPPKVAPPPANGNGPKP